MFIMAYAKCLSLIIRLINGPGVDKNSIFQPESSTPVNKVIIKHFSISIVSVIDF